MKKHFFLLFFCVAVSMLSAAEMKVLTIGNSFANSLYEYFPLIAKAQGDTLKLAFANHGGCTLQRHWKYISEEEKDPAKKHYKIGKQKAKLRELLASDSWDIVSIQQAKAWGTGNFYPELDYLIAYVRKHAPRARIVFHQPWSYREDSKTYKTLKTTPGKLFSEIEANYKKISKKYSIDIIPAGLAVQIGRTTQKVKFTPVPRAIAETVQDNQFPPEPGSFYRGWYWKKDPKTDKKILGCDPNHLNSRGRYLQACVWYGFVFNKSPLEIKYNGRIDPADAAFLRQCADKALKAYKK